MKTVPWSQVQDWRCLGCGECCQLQVQLTTKEWLNIAQTYGYNFVDQSIDGLRIRKTMDNWCPFLYRQVGRRDCTLQHSKPLACTLWPFRISDYPRYGNSVEAKFQYYDRTYYVYLIPHCRGIFYGRPTERFIRNVVPEFVELRLGLRSRQVFSTRGKLF